MARRAKTAAKAARHFGRGADQHAGEEEPRAPGRRWPALRLPPRADRTIAVVVATIHLALALLTYTPAPHMGGDNAGYVTLAHSLLQGSGYRELWDPAEPLHTKYPPVYPVVLAIAAALGARSWDALKLVSILFTTLGALFAYLWAAERRGRLFALALALLIAGSDSLVWASHWILSEAPFVAFTLCALWAFERGERRDFAARWVLAGVLTALLAYFTRSAGLPLVLAMLAWLALRRRWRTLAAAALAFAVPATLWWLRARSGVGEGYVSEFWMRDPYRPELGTADAVALLARFLRNLWLYTREFVPGGLTGYKGLAVTIGGVLLAAVALAGWVRRARRRPGVAELMLPLYLGLIFLWPTVWSGDRFALPVLPLLVFYGGEMVVEAARRIGRGAAVAAGALAFLIVAVPAGFSLREETEKSAICMELTRAEGPFACYGERTREFAAAAMWSGANLREDGVVLARKPRIFYVLSGLHSRAYPLTDDPSAFYDAAREAGARYVLVDYLDRLGGLYLIPIIRETPGGFCYIAGFGDQESQTLLFGILREEEREPAAEVESGEGYFTLDMAPCQPSLLREPPGKLPPPGSRVIPLLSREEP